MNHFLRYLWFVVVVRPLVWLILGVGVRNRDRLIASQPAIVVANHNSHLDTIVLTSLFPLRLLRKLRPVAAMDYFLKTRALAWFALNIIGIIPLDRKPGKGRKDPLAPCSEALERGEVLILFPEGTRGEPERMESFKTGIAHLAKRHPDIPVIPVFMHGLGKALPRGECILVPFFCDVVVGEAMHWSGNRDEFMTALDATMKSLASEINCAPWE